MGLLGPGLQGLFPLKSRNAVLEEDKVVNRANERGPQQGAPEDPLRGRSKLQALQFPRTGRHPVPHVSFGAHRTR
jgi:hypothetical protein